MAFVPKNAAIPARDGVSPSCVSLPQPAKRAQTWPTLLDFLAERLPMVSRAEWAQRMRDGLVLDEQATRLTDPDTPYRTGERIYYYRWLADEPEVPFNESVVFEDEHLLVADKPHFLPVLPGGRFVQQTLLVRLKRKTGIETLSPIHRIDRETAGLVLFSKRPQDRAGYQAMFREREVHKTYEALAPWLAALSEPVCHRSHLAEDPQRFYRMQECPGLAPNSETRVSIHERRGDMARYRLEPVTGKRHQLRVHLQALGAPIIGDQFYPEVKRGPDEAEDFANPLRLLAKAIAFEDPVTGEQRRFESRLELAWPDDTD